jgi:hypothetical protein
MDNLAEVVVVLVLIAFVAVVIWRRKKTQQKNALMKADMESAIKEAHDIVAAYGEVLERTSKPGIAFHSQADLPYPKEQIRKCIEMLLVLTHDDDTRLNTLEVGNVFLNNFIPDEEYRLIIPQMAGLSQALKAYADGERDAMQILKTATDGVTQEGEAHLRQVQERTRRENLLTLERHKKIAANRSRLADLGVK